MAEEWWLQCEGGEWEDDDGHASCFLYTHIYKQKKRDGEELRSTDQKNCSFPLLRPAKFVVLFFREFRKSLICLFIMSTKK